MHQFLSLSLSLSTTLNANMVTATRNCLFHFLGSLMHPPIFGFLEHSCYNEDGRDYRGVASRTVSNQECLPWNSQFTVGAAKTSEHPELIGGHNYCRNPGGIELQPWCFVGPASRPHREFCSLPKCCNFCFDLCLISLTHSFTTLIFIFEAMGFEINWLYIGIPSATIGALLILLLIVVCVRRQKRKSKSKAAMKNPYCGPIINGTSIARVPGQQLEMSALLPPGNSVATLQGPLTNRILAPEFSLHSVRFQQDLGEGAFGKVMDLCQLPSPSHVNGGSINLIMEYS